MTDRELKIAIAHAKWSVEYDLQRVSETAAWDGSIGMIDRLLSHISSGLLGRVRIDPRTAADEIAELRKSSDHLSQLSNQAIRRGIDPNPIPIRARHEYLGDIQ